MNSTSNTPTALEERRADQARLYSPSTGRNRQAIVSVLAPTLPKAARVLEIGSGTGEHALAVCEERTDISWQPSDPDSRSRQSQSAWAGQAAGQIAEPLDLDLTATDWTDRVEAFDALVCINVIHISPWRVTENLAAGAAALLKPGGVIYLYGPYQEGAETAQSNLDFDASLRSRNADWGVRDLERVLAVFSRAGFNLENRFVMPANNLSLIFKAGDSDASS
jgi:SAM-dependent methyltransferase